MNKWVKRNIIAGSILACIAVLCAIWAVVSGQMRVTFIQIEQISVEQSQSSPQTVDNKQEKVSIRIAASGDFLYHIGVYRSAWNGTTYDFANDYEQIQPLISNMDLAIGDFEGTISSEYELSGYPLFNAPIEVVSSIKSTGYDVVTLANNHILDSRLSGLQSTVKAFNDAGIDTVGVKANSSTPDIFVKDVKGIKVAILAYSYGFNGMENTLSDEEYAMHMKDLNPKKIQKDLQEAEKLADITVVLPHMGVEYQLEPTQEQKELYHQMIEWGADVIFGGHPHVIEPTEIIKKDGEQKFILYSMGNLLSNQRYETVDNNYWTERGVIMEVEVTKNNGKTTITNIVPHPTWVSREELGYQVQGRTAYDYQVFLAEDYLPNGKYVHTVSATKQARIQKAYEEVMELLDLKFKKSE